MSNAEQELLQRAIHGDDEAFGGLVEMYQNPVYNLCYRMLGDSQSAEDAAQESFWKAYQALKKYDSQRSFITWLLSITAHHCIDQQRKRRVIVTEMDDIFEETFADSAPLPEKELIKTADQSTVQAMLQMLNETERAAIIMRYWYKYSEEEISKSLNLSVSAVKSRLFRARQKLANHWNDPTIIQKSEERMQDESPAF